MQRLDKVEQVVFSALIGSFAVHMLLTVAFVLKAPTEPAPPAHIAPYEPWTRGGQEAKTRFLAPTARALLYATHAVEFASCAGVVICVGLRDGRRRREARLAEEKRRTDASIASDQNDQG